MKTTPGPLASISDPVARFHAFVVEREAIRVARASGAPPPWTEDEILQNYRFCNVRREDDKVTRWLRACYWREHRLAEPDLWFAMTVARFINWPDTLKELGWVLPWDPKRFLITMRVLRGRGKKVYSGAYMVQAGREGLSKAAFQVQSIFNPLWRQRETLRPKPSDTLNSYHTLLGAFYGLGSFMAAQVVADLKYVEPLKSASDWWAFAASGPGSRRGLNRLLGRSIKSPWTEDNWRMELGRAQLALNAVTNYKGIGPLHAQDVQNCLCEFDKYERTRLGQGRPRAKFKGGAP